MKKGFTLIELLAVIVILAIIALIATPIVLNIIDDSEKSAYIRSAEFYVKAVQNKIMQENMKQGTFNPKKCDISDKGILCDDMTDYLAIEIDGEKPIGGYVIFDNGKLINASVEFTGDTVVKNALGQYVSLKNDIVCKGVVAGEQTTGNVPKNNFAIGDEYMCEVSEGVEYRFFILSVEDNKVNLISERNINNNGGIAASGINYTTPVNGIYNKMLWITADDYVDAGGSSADYGSSGKNDKGPLTALKFVTEATKKWEKIDNLNEEYEDENIVWSTETKGTTGYGKIKLTGKARLPKYNELKKAGCTKTGCPLWLINYLAAGSITAEGFTSVSNMNGYWLLSSETTQTVALTVNYLGKIGKRTINSTPTTGVRPVISVTKESFY